MKVLVIDDEPIIRLALKRALESKGHQVLEADGGKAGIGLWLNQSPDLVFLDVLMPGQSGLQVLREIGKSNKAVVLLMSAYSGAHAESDMADIGADGFLKKPFDNVFDAVETGERLVNGGSKS
jgi:DNA-binding response OmpR family regulator